MPTLSLQSSHQKRRLLASTLKSEKNARIISQPTPQLSDQKQQDSLSPTDALNRQIKKINHTNYSNRTHQ